jgi:ribokinase
VLTILNFAPAIKEINNETFFEFTDYLILNETEVETLIGKEIKSIDDAFKASKKILEFKGIHEGVAITLGEKGVVWQSKQSETNELAFHVSSPKVNVIDTSGAGDAFCGAFANYLAKLGSKQIKRVIELACEYASFTVQSKGTQTSYPFLNEIDTKFN